MQQEDFIWAQSAQAQADHNQTQQQQPYTQNQNMQGQHTRDPNMQYSNLRNQYVQDPNMQYPDMQDPTLQHRYVQAPNIQIQDHHIHRNPSAQNAYAQHPQNSASHVPGLQNDTREGDFLHDGHRYNIHALHRLIDSRHPNSPPPSNRGANAFVLPLHGTYGPHNASPRPQPRLGLNGRPMIQLEHFGHRGEWVEMPDGQAYRRDTEENRAERERNIAADLEFIERNPHRLGPTWRPSWRRW